MKKEASQGEDGSAGLAESANMTDKNIFGEVLLVRDKESTSKDKSWMLDSGSAVHLCSTKIIFSTFV